MRKRAVCALVLLVGVAGSAPSRADVFTVGPAGGFATIQAALTRASQTPVAPTSMVFHEIRVQSGTYDENLRAPNPCCGLRSIRIIGGWNSAFTSSSYDPALTVIDGRSRGRVLTVPRLNAGSLYLTALTLRGGYLRAGGPYGLGYGAGLQASLSASAEMLLYRVVLRNNTIRGEGSGEAEAQGAGASMVLEDDAGVILNETRFQTNMIVPASATLSSLGGGLNLQVFGGAATIRKTRFEGNWAYGQRISTGGGMYALIQKEGGIGLALEDSWFEGNVVEDSRGEGAGATVGGFDGNGTVTARIERCRFLKNVVGRSQLLTAANGNTRLEISDSLVANGSGGVVASASGGHNHVRNLTVANNERRGVQAYAVNGGTLSVFNTIAYENAGGDMSVYGASGSTATSGFNLVGIDPRFVNPTAGNYALDGASPAADTGTNTPPLALGFLDILWNDRVYNATVDIGAYEWHP